MRYFVDAEFDGFGGPLISLAAVPESEEVPPFYEAVTCTATMPWVHANVLPVLQTRPRPRAEVAGLFADYLASDPAPVIIADWPEDIAHAVSLLTDGRGGRLLGAAVRFELLAQSGFASERLSAVSHNAYHDAVALRDWVLERQ